jgi:hypothetical protein
MIGGLWLTGQREPGFPDAAILPASRSLFVATRWARIIFATTAES